MRLRHPDGSLVHLSYCSNVHAAEDLDGVVAQLGDYAAPIREALGWEVLGVGLWLAADVAAHLDQDPTAVTRLRTALADAGVEVTTLNGFPYTGFHDEVVKLKVYHPDWRDPARQEHTMRLARVLAALLPDDVATGSISTLPLGWRTEMDAQGTATARAGLEHVADGLAQLEADTGRRIVIAVEPEPGCRIETTHGLAEVLGGADPTHLGACLDLCHLAVQFEDPQEALGRLAAAGLPVHKVQVSAGLVVAAPARDHLDLVQPHTSSPFMHQVRERDADGVVTSVDDLPEALDGGLPGVGEWRTHVHLPVHHDDAATTQPVLLDALAALVGGPKCLATHLEVETYTWEVLPDERRGAPADPRAQVVTGIAAELAWTAEHLAQLGVVPA